MKVKKFFIGLGQAALYFGAYFGAQVVVSFAISLVISVVISISMIQPDGSFNEVAYTVKATEALARSMNWIMIASGLVALLIFWIVTLIRKKKLFREVSLNKMKPAALAPIVIGGVAFNFAISYIMSLIPFPQTWIESYEASSSDVLGGTGIAMWIAVVIMAPIVEEITFRGFMYSRLKSGMAKWIATLVVSLVFGMVHGTIIWAMYTFVFSLCLIFILERTKSLWGCIAFHMAFNLVGATMSAWPKLEYAIEDFALWVLIGSVVITIGCAAWFVLLTKKKEVEEEINTQIPENQMTY